MPTTTAWRFELDVEGLGWLTIDRPGAPVNTLSREALTSILPQLPGARILDGAFHQAGMAVAVPSGIQVFAWIATFASGKVQMKTPTLFIHGEIDQRVPYSEAEQMYVALKKNGVPAKMIQYKGMPHGISGNWQNWLENIPRVARERRVIALDLPGFGESDRPSGVRDASGSPRPNAMSRSVTVAGPTGSFDGHSAMRRWARPAPTRSTRGGGSTRPMAGGTRSSCSTAMANS